MASIFSWLIIGIGFVVWRHFLIASHSAAVFHACALSLILTVGAVTTAQRYLGNRAKALALILAGLAVWSLVPSRASLPVAYAALVTGAALAGWQLWIARRGWTLPKLSVERAILWTGLFLVTPFLSVETSKGTFAAETFHPLYELSFGFSFRQTLFGAPDLAYFGKTASYHFLSTLLPFPLAEFWNLTELQVIYTVAPVILLVLFLYSVEAMLEFFPNTAVGNRFLLLFCPSFSWWGISAWEGIFQRTIAFTLSYHLALVQTLTAVALALAGAWGYFFVVAGLLVLTKASFYVVIAGGVVFALAVDRRWRELFFVGGGLAIIFLASFKLFLAGAHVHNHWLVFPSAIWMGIVDNLPIYQIGANVAFSAVVVLILAAVAYRAPRGSAIRFAACLALVGQLGAVGLTEASEANTAQFIIPVTFFSILTLLNFFAGQSRAKALVGKIILLVFAGVSTQNLVARYRTEIARAHSPNLEPKFFTGVGIGTERAYGWARSQMPADAVILFSRHYESGLGAMDGDEPFYASDSGFTRSALSGRQMWIENYKYRGIGMLDNFPERFAESIYFYLSLVDTSPEGRKFLLAFAGRQFGNSPALPFTRESVGKSKILYWAGLGKRWSWINREPHLKTLIRDKLRPLLAMTPKEKNLWAERFLAQTGITHIALEDGERAGDWLKDRTQEIYSDRGISFLKITPAKGATSR